ncbi:IDEAL domain-containing protein [Robertmurraya korlensis]|uniref:IDEAL domain-containing protein n=1 Tax=Robertmurraya korlensis TaxID=519977 RepID=UPI0020415D5F|nr:IDEAL domain-containing protein [Robertmurraya korlensis]MCM3601265.1 IDEAL domain-containing protein [Robertmurraya korlensis]
MKPTPYIAVNTFDHQIDCFCPDADHSEVVTIHRGDIIEISPERKYTVINGWYALVIINQSCSFYMAVEDIEWYFTKEQLISMLDVDLQINYYQYKINQALDEGDEKAFMNFTDKMNHSYEMKGKLLMYLRNVAV